MKDAKTKRETGWSVRCLLSGRKDTSIKKALFFSFPPLFALSRRERRERIGEFLLVFGLLYLPRYLLQEWGNGRPEQRLIEYAHLETHAIFLSVACIHFFVFMNLIKWDGRYRLADFGWRRPARTLVITAPLAAFSLWKGEWILSSLWEGGRALAFAWPPLALLTFTTCLSVGYTEEFFFRSYAFLRYWEFSRSRAGSLLFVNTLFAAGHLTQGVEGVVVSFVIGMVFSFFFLQGRSLHFLAVTHGLINFLSLAWWSSSPLP